MRVIISDILLVCLVICIIISLIRYYINRKLSCALNYVKDSSRYRKTIQKFQRQNEDFFADKLPPRVRKLSFLLQFAWLFCFLGQVRRLEHRDDERRRPILIGGRGVPIQDLPGGPIIVFVFWEIFLLISIFYLTLCKESDYVSGFLLIAAPVCYWLYYFFVGLKTILLLKYGCATRGIIICPYLDKYVLFIDKNNNLRIIPYRDYSTKDKKTGKSVLVLYNDRNSKQAIVYDGLQEWKQLELTSSNEFTLPKTRYRLVLAVVIGMIILIALSFSENVKNSILMLIRFY